MGTDLHACDLCKKICYYGWMSCIVCKDIACLDECIDETSNIISNCCYGDCNEGFNLEYKKYYKTEVKGSEKYCACHPNIKKYYVTHLKKEKEDEDEDEDDETYYKRYNEGPEGYICNKCITYKDIVDNKFECYLFKLAGYESHEKLYEFLAKKAGFESLEKVKEKYINE